MKVVTNAKSIKDVSFLTRWIKLSQLLYSKKFKAHDENNEAKVGDIVKIMETRPLSATKRFRLLEIVEKAVIL